MKLKASLQEISTLYGFPWGCFTPIDFWGKWGTSYYDPSISKNLLVKKKILYLHLKETEKTSSMFHIQMKQLSPLLTHQHLDSLVIMMTAQWMSQA